MGCSPEIREGFYFFKKVDNILLGMEKRFSRKSRLGVGIGKIWGGADKAVVGGFVSDVCVGMDRMLGWLKITDSELWEIGNRKFGSFR